MTIIEDPAGLPDEGYVPEWDLADRMRKALRVRGLGVEVIAEAFDVSRATVGRWINGRGVPSKVQLHFFADLTGVDAEWLRTGVPAAETHEPPVNGGHDRRLLQRARRDSNPKPSDWESLRRSGVNARLTVNHPVLTVLRGGRGRVA